MTALLPYLVHSANLLYLLSYLVRDILWLRIFTIIAGSSLLPYYYCQPSPMWEPIAWNLVFISINVVQSVLLILDRRPVHLKGDDLKLYQLVFDRLSPQNFRKLLELGEWRQTDADGVIVSADSAIDRVIVIYEGELAVKREERELARLEPGCFVGEMSFLTGKKASADVVALAPTRHVSWSFDALRQFLPKHPELRAAFQNILGADLVRKLNPAK